VDAELARDVERAVGIETPQQIALLAAFILLTVASMWIAVVYCLRWSGPSRSLLYKTFVGVPTLAAAIGFWSLLYLALDTEETYNLKQGRRATRLVVDVKGPLVDVSDASMSFWAVAAFWYLLAWLFSVFTLCMWLNRR
jgi:hypothetical protein